MKNVPSMPIYEYGCLDCRKRVSVFFRTLKSAETVEAVCPNCGKTNLRRLMSRVGRLRSEESRLESLADPSNLSGLDEQDPRSLARLMRQMSSETGEDLGEEFEEMVGRLEAGEDPSSLAGAGGEDWDPGAGL